MHCQFLLIKQQWLSWCFSQHLPPPPYLHGWQLYGILLLLHRTPREKGDQGSSFFSSYQLLIPVRREGQMGWTCRLKAKLSDHGGFQWPMLSFLSTKDNEAFFFFFSFLFLTLITNIITPFPLQSTILTFIWDTLAIGLWGRTPTFQNIPTTRGITDQGPQLFGSGSISTLAPGTTSHGLLPASCAPIGHRRDTETSPFLEDTGKLSLKDSQSLMESLSDCSWVWELPNSLPLS